MLSIHELQTRRALTRPLRSTLLLPLLAVVCIPAGFAQSVGMVHAGGDGEVKKRPAPARLADTARLGAAAILEPAMVGARDEVDAITAWNQAGNLPTRNGFSRTLPREIAFRPVHGADHAEGTYAEAGIDGGVAWTTRVRVEGSHRLRLLLTGVSLPAGARLWVYSEDGETAGPFGRELVSESGEMWTPSVAGPSITLEVRTQPGARFKVTRALELFQLDTTGAVRSITAHANESCLVDGRCINAGTYNAIADVRHAIGYVEFVKDGSGYSCTGSLLNDSDPSGFIPFFLTANHCFSTQASSNTVEVFWDYYTGSCDGTFPSLNGLPKSNGATLLATGAATDFTLVRLNSIPGGRVLLGWNANLAVVGNNVQLHRLSNPLGYPQHYSRTKIDSTPDTCASIPTSNYLYSSKQQGATFPGSSGSPALLPDGVVVGQLRGGCATNPNEPCLFASDDSFIDGRFSGTFNFISQFLVQTFDTTPCVRTATVSCLQGNRFEIRLTYTNPSSSGTAAVMAFNGQRAENNESAFYFFTGATNFEMGLKVLNACGLNNRFWVFVSGLTDQGWTLTVRDTVSGVTKTYTNANAHLTSTTGDTAAFLCP